MFQVTVTSQKQVSLPTKLIGMVGVEPGDKLNLSVANYKGEKVIVARKSSDWESLRGILKKYTRVRRYPTAEEIADAWAADYRQKWLKNEEDSS